MLSARFADVPQKLIDPNKNMATEKSVFMVFFSGSAINAKVAKICDAFEANRYSIPEDHDTQVASLTQCQARLSALETMRITSPWN